MSIFLETKRLIIHAPKLTDFDNLYALQSDAEVMKYVGKGVRTKTEVMTGLETAINHYEKHGFSLAAVTEKETGLFVGRAGLIYLYYDDTQTDIEVGYALIKSAWGKGYATELTTALIDWGFNHLPINRLVAVINPGNDASRRVLQRAQMKFVGLTQYNNADVELYDIHKPARKV